MAIIGCRTATRICHARFEARACFSWNKSTAAFLKIIESVIDD